MKKVLLIASAIVVAATPALASAAATVNNFSDISSTIGSLTNLINIIIPFFIGLAVLFFIYGLIKYVLSAGDEEARKGARSYIIYGIIAIAVMLSVWGLVNLLVRSLGFDKETRPVIYPQTPGCSAYPCTPNSG